MDFRNIDFYHDLEEHDFRQTPISTKNVAFTGTLDAALMHRLLDAKFKELESIHFACSRLSRAHVRPVDVLCIKCDVDEDAMDAFGASAKRKLEVYAAHEANISVCRGAVHCEEIEINANGKSPDPAPLIQIIETSTKLKRVSALFMKWSAETHMGVLGACHRRGIAYMYAGSIPLAIGKYFWMYGFPTKRIWSHDVELANFFVPLYHALRGPATPLRKLLRGDGDNAIMWRVIQMLYGAPRGV